ncbi:MAG: response regulator [Fibrobacterota bacterium]|nr:response regulator [Fibrobacterota bacterium]QQS03841.1 MAG: response regulator [Fibrobacterota bacterium]
MVEYSANVSDPLIRKLLGMVRQLLPIEDLDQLLRAGVELPREILGIERCALWLLNLDGQSFRGTWGTGTRGETTDERSQTCKVVDLEETLHLPFQSLEGWILRQDPARLTWTPDGKQVEGSGWNTIIPLSGPEGNVGAFFQDAAITNSPLDPHLQDLMSIYCSLLGQMAARRLAEKREFFLSHGLEEVLGAADELMTYDDLDTLHRRIVELARERLGVARCGLFLAREGDPYVFSGAWGTDWDGNTTDEHKGSIDLRNRDIEVVKSGVSEIVTKRWSVLQPFRMSWFEPDGSRKDHSEGWNALHRLGVQDRTLGYICSDPGKSLEPLDPRRMDVLATYCGLVARILERHQTQEGLRHAMEAATAATKAKSDFLATMSHEIRTPMAGVLGLLRIALRDPALSIATRDLLQNALGNADSLLGILNDIMDYSKIEAGKLSLECIDFSPRELVTSSLSGFAEAARARGIEFRVVVDPNLSAFLRGDPTRMRQILSNLVGNAVKFTEKGKVEIRVESARGASDPGLVAFEVVDSGIGIPADILPRLFSKFEQADMSTTRRFGGTGLGLAICRRLVEAMGGTIVVRSRLGQGSSFRVEIPFQAGAEIPPSPTTKLTPHTHRLQVLCAEDFATTQLIVRSLLEDRGHSVDIVENGKLALERLAFREYDLVLMDGRMPVMDGLEAIGHLRAGSWGDLVFRDPQVTVIALTANVSDEDRRLFLSSGMDDFLAKPIDESAFHAAVERAIQRQLERGRPLLPLPKPTPSSLDAFFEVSSDDREPETSTDLPAANANLQQQLEQTFRQTLPARIDELTAALGKEDCWELGRLFHGIKGSAGYVKAAEIVKAAQALEAQADQDDLAAVRAGFPRFLELLAPWKREEKS